MNSHARQEMDIKTREILLAEFKEGIWTAEQYREQIALLNGDEAPHRAAVTTMFNSGPYPVTPVALQLYSSTLERITYSSHGRADIPPLCTTLGLIPI